MGDRIFFGGGTGRQFGVKSSAAVFMLKTAWCDLSTRDALFSVPTTDAVGEGVSRVSGMVRVSLASPTV